MQNIAHNLGMLLRIPPKLLLIMRLTTFILIIALAQVSAKGFGQKITLNTNHTPIEKVLQSIRDQSGYRIFYDADDLKNQHVTININNLSVEEAIKATIKGLPLNYKIVKNSIVLSKEEPSFLERFFRDDDDGKLADIRGVVRNERGEALEGITVMVKGAKTGTRTNVKGEFVLKGIKKGDVLVFTGVAIEPFEYTVKDDKNIDLNLKARLVQLEEVGINTGYQKISKERYVGSYSQLDSAAFHRRTGMGILERLDGTVTGVLFNKKSGEGASPNNSPIQIRGLSTLSSNENPLIIVDNFPYTFDLSTINPNDIENVTVLKDAAATSIWGARAGNGVIVITTKKAKFNQPLNVSWNSNVSIQEKPDLYHYPQVNSSDFIDFEKYLFSKGAYDGKLYDPIGLNVSPVVEILNKVKNGNLTENEGKIQIDRLRTIDSREQLDRYVYQQRIAQQHYINIGGGSSNVNYSISLGYNNTKPNIQNSKHDDQYTIISTASFKPGKKLNISTGINLNHSSQNSASLPDLPLYPYEQLADEKGNALILPYRYRLSYLDTVGGGELLDWYYRPLDEIKLSNQNNISRTASINANISYMATSWLNFNLQGQYNLLNNENKSIKSLETYEVRDLINQFTNLSFTDNQRRYPVPMGGIVDGNNVRSNAYNVRAGMSINKNWAEHQLTAMISGDLSESRSSANNYRFYGYQPDFSGFNPNIDYNNYYGISTGSSARIPNGSAIIGETNQRLVSLLGNVSYVFRNRYTLYGSARRDASNLFGVTTNNKWKPLWSLGAAWQIDKEQFFHIPWVDQLNLKTTYGYSGNVNNTVPGLLTISYFNFPDPRTGLKRALINNPPNSRLRWEEIRMFNTSIDFSLIRNRIAGNIQYFRKIATDLISLYPLPASTGVYLQSLNVASLKGNGMELNLSVKVAEGNFGWKIDGGLSYAKMKVVKVFGSNDNKWRADAFLNFGVNSSEGKVAYGLGSYKWGGLDPQTGEPLGILDGEISKDYSRINVDSIDHQNFHGSAIPLYSGFLMNTISWKNLSLSFNVGYKLGYYFRKPVLKFFNPTSLKFLPTDYYDRWQKPGDEKHTNVPAFNFPASSIDSQFFYANSEINVLRGDHIRLQDLRLQYSLGKGLRPVSFIKGMSASLYVNNLNVMLWRKNKSGLDPDFAGSFYLQAPTPKTWAIGLSANF